MRDRLIDRLDTVAYRRFLVYLMGPYKSFDIGEILPEDTSADDPGVPFDDWIDGSSTEYEERDVQMILERVRDTLRDDDGLNAFLAIDVDVPLDEMDAASQSIAFARASNVVALVAPQVGKNLGVGIETGSVLEALGDERQERVVFVHERGVRSAMIDSLSRRWDATVLTYADEEELIDRLRTFSVQVMNDEHTGVLSELDE